MIGDVAARHLGVEPLPYIALAASAPPGDLVRAQRTATSHRLVETQLVANTDHDAAVASRKLPKKPADQCVERLLIDRHCPLHLCRSAPCALKPKSGCRLALETGSARLANDGSFVPGRPPMPGTTRPLHVSLDRKSVV